MEHSEAVRTGAAERYLLGEMSEAEGAAFEEHYFACVECAAEVRAAGAFVEGAARVLRERTGPAEAETDPERRGLAWLDPMPGGAVAVLLAALVALAV